MQSLFIRPRPFLLGPDDRASVPQSRPFSGDQLAGKCAAKNQPSDHTTGQAPHAWDGCVKGALSSLRHRLAFSPHCSLHQDAFPTQA